MKFLNTSLLVDNFQTEEISRNIKQNIYVFYRQQSPLYSFFFLIHTNGRGERKKTVKSNSSRVQENCL